VVESIRYGEIVEVGAASSPTPDRPCLALHTIAENQTVEVVGSKTHEAECFDESEDPEDVPPDLGIGVQHSWRAREAKLPDQEIINNARVLAQFEGIKLHQDALQMLSQLKHDAVMGSAGTDSWVATDRSEQTFVASSSSSRESRSLSCDRTDAVEACKPASIDTAAGVVFAARERSPPVSRPRPFSALTAGRPPPGSGAPPTGLKCPLYWLGESVVLE